jgi:hypothetical protein
MTETNERSKQIRNEVVDYEQTVRALLAFAALVVHDGDVRREGAQFGFGRRMSPSGHNAEHPKPDVTPDLVAQKSRSYGIVAEAKKSLSQEQKQWRDILEQLRKYDDDLVGWWTEESRIAHSDTVLMLHQSRSRDFVGFTKDQRSRDASVFGETSSIVEFGESQETVTYYFFRREYGDIKDVDLSTKLQKGVSVPLGEVLKTFSNIQYYDADPPLVLVLTYLWMEYLPPMREHATYDDNRRSWLIKASVSETTEEIQRAHGSGALYRDTRAAEFPRKTRIREAFDFLVTHKLAESPSDGGDEYLILYKQFRDDVREHFIRLEAGPTSKKPSQGQMALFEE